MFVLQRRPDVLPYFAQSADASNFTRHLSQFASVPSKIGTPIVFLVSKMPPASAASVSTTGSRGLALHTSNRRRRVNHKLKCQFSNVAAPLPELSVRCGEGDAMECVCFGTVMA